MRVADGFEIRTYRRKILRLFKPSKPQTEGPGRAPYCSVTPGFAIHGLAISPTPLTRHPTCCDKLSRLALPSELIE